MSRCPECGADPGFDARFCRACGMPLPASGTDDDSAVPDDPAARGPYGMPSRTASPADTVSMGYGGNPGHRAGPSRRSRAPVIVASVIALVIVVAGVTAAALATRPGSAGQSSAGAPGASGPAEQQAVTRLAVLLGISARDRRLADRAYHAVLTCAPALSRDVVAFQQAATSEQQLVARLASMPGESALPVPLATLLTQAWQESAMADQSFAAWAADENAETCTPGATADRSLRSGGALQIGAGDLKTLVIRRWNPLATRYGLPTYRAAQI